LSTEGETCEDYSLHADDCHILDRLHAGCSLHAEAGVWPRAGVTESQRTTRTIPRLQSDVEAGTTITRAHIGLGPWDRSKTPEPDAMLNSSMISNWIAKEKITAATPLRGSMFYAPGDFPELALPAVLPVLRPRAGQLAEVQAKLATGRFEPGLLMLCSRLASAGVSLQRAVSVRVVDAVQSDAQTVRLRFQPCVMVTALAVTGSADAAENRYVFSARLAY